MASLRLDPRTGLPATRVVASPSTGLFPSARAALTASPLPRLGAPQLPYDEYGLDTNSPAPQFPGYPAPKPNPVGAAAAPSSSGAPPSGTQTSPGTSPPDYAAIIASDPGLRALRAALAAGDISADQFRRQAIQRALTVYGAVPEGIQDPYGDITQTVRDLAQKNTAEGLSTRAQEDRAHQAALQGLQDTLAARGMLQSGALGAGLGLEGQQDKATRTKDVQDLLDYLTGQATAYAQHVNQSKTQEAQGIGDATQRAYQNYPDMSGGTTTPGKYTITSNGKTFDFGANGKPTWALVRNAQSLPGNTAPTGVGNAMYNADDPTLDANMQAAKQAGNQAGIWIVPHAGETGAQLGARAAELSKKYGVPVMIDSELSSKGYPGSPQYQYTADFVNAYQQGGGQGMSVTVQGGGEDDYNYKAVADAGGTIWIQTYGEKMTDLFDPQAAVNKMIARGVPVSQIGVMLAPGQAVPHGPNGEPIQWSLYTVDDLGNTQFPGAGTGPASSPPAGSPLANAISAAQSTGNYSPETLAQIARLVQENYTNPVITTPSVRPTASRPGME